MLMVKTYMAPSKVHGIGLYAAEDIPAHTIVWKFHAFVDKVLTGSDFFRICQGIDTPALHHILSSTYKRSGQYFYLTDNARFINHSEEGSNIIFVDDFSEVASRHIYPGEEILENYSLSYDTNDFFFTEHLDPDPYCYIQREREIAYA